MASPVRAISALKSTSSQQTANGQCSIDGADFYVGGGGSNVAAFGGTSALYSPDVSVAGLSTGMAVAIYPVDLSHFSGDQTVSLVWNDLNAPVSSQGLYIGLGNLQRDAWDWFTGPTDGVLTIDSFGPYRDAGGKVLVAVVLLGDKEADLDQLLIGAPEQRGTGASSLSGFAVGLLPLLAPSVKLPPAADLTSGCAPVSDQGGLGTCTAFAIGDGAFNLQLNQLYAPYGWDLTNAHYRVSPKYLYVLSGEREGAPANYQAGRSMPSVLTSLQSDGVATEEDAPYDSVYSTNFSPAAQADAGLMRADSWSQVPSNSAEGLVSMKQILASEHLPLVMQLNLDDSFTKFDQGVWNYAGPTYSEHALCIVGYDDGRQAFKARNSWGQDWGADGYVWIGYATFLNPAAGTFVWSIHNDFDVKLRNRLCPLAGAPQPVVGVTASDGTSGEVSVTWQPYSGATGFEIYRDSTAAPLAHVGTQSDQWLDTGVNDVYGHIYWVCAATPSGHSPLSVPDVGYCSSAPQVRSIGPGAGVVGQQITFSATGTGSAPLTFAWDFGGGALPNSSSDQSPQVKLIAPGPHTARLVLSNHLGSTTKLFQLDVAPLKPTILGIAHRSGFSGDQAFPTATLTGSSDGIYSWDFGAGATPEFSDSATPQITLGEPGKYQASLTVTTAIGSDTRYFYLTVDDVNAQWRMTNGDRAQNCQIAINGPASSQLKWRLFLGQNPATPDVIIGAPVYGAFGTIYCMTCYGGLFAVSPDGRMLWRQPDTISTNGLSGAPLVLTDTQGTDNSVLAFSTSQAVAKCFSLSDHSLAWTYPLNASGSALAIQVSGDRLCIADSSAYLHILSTSGYDYGGIKLPGSAHSLVGLAADASGNVFGASSIALSAYDSLNHHQLWVVQGLPAALVAGPVLSPDQQTVYVTDNTSTVYGFDATSGAQIFASPSFAGATMAGTGQPVVAVDGSLRLLNKDFQLLNLNPDNGKTLPGTINFATGSVSYNPLVIDRSGTFYASADNSSLVYSYASDTSMRWLFDVGTPVKSPMSLSPAGTLCFGANGYLYAIGYGGDGSDHVPPFVSSVSPAGGSAGSKVQFQAYLNGGGASSYLWHFGGAGVPNGSVASAPTVTLGAVGSYSGDVTVTNSYGSNLFQFTIEVF